MLAAHAWSLWRSMSRGASHALANASQVLSIEPLPPRAREEAVERIARVAGLIGAIPRRPTGAPTLLPDVLAELEACEASQLAMPAGVLTIDLSPGLPALAVPSADLLVALLAVVTNAKEATPGHAAAVRLRARAVGTGIEISVTDGGSGFAPGARAAAFEPGAAPRDDAHLGLGLWAARTLLRLHGGDVQLGEGAEVRLLAPAWTRGDRPIR